MSLASLRPARLLAGTLLVLAGSAVLPGAAAAQEVPCGAIRSGLSFQYTTLMLGDKLYGDSTEYPRVGTVCPGSPAERAGLAVGDVLLQVNGRDIRDRAAREPLRAGAGGAVVLRFRRGDIEREATLVLPPRRTEPAPATQPR